MCTKKETITLKKGKPLKKRPKMDDEPPDSEIYGLEKVLREPEIKSRGLKEMDLIVRKNPLPILFPEKYNGKYTSIRNPAAFIYQDRCGLLCTVRHAIDNKSRLHLAWSTNNKDFFLEKTPFIDTDQDSLKGVEDARVTKINDEYFITFTAFKEHLEEKGVNTTRIGLTKTKDFENYYKRKIILDNKKNNKNGLIFKNEDYHWVIDRPFDGGFCNETPYAQISKTKDIEKFGEFKSFLKPRKNMWDDARVGANTPPIKIKHDIYGDVFFMLYHGASKKGNIYRMGYVLLDEKNPSKILERSENPLLSPELDWEKGVRRFKAEVPNVVFGCGAIPIGKDTIRIFYAGADKYTSFADIKIPGAEVLEPIYLN